jgi:cytochrome c-type biogenesis protein CcmE
MTDSQRQRRLWYVIGGVMVVAFAVYGFSSFKTNLTPYVSFEDAMRTGTNVQIAGGLVPDSSRWMEDKGQLEFGLVADDGSTLQVHYDGVKPGNFEEATQIVAIGSYSDGVFHAKQLLVKCPSKYQGVEGEERSYGSKA